MVTASPPLACGTHEARRTERMAPLLVASINAKRRSLSGASVSHRMESPRGFRTSSTAWLPSAFARRISSAPYLKASAGVKGAGCGLGFPAPRRSGATQANNPAATCALRIRCEIGGGTIGLRFEVIGKHRTEWHYGHQRPARDLPAKTPLRLSLDRSLRVPLTAAWSDTPSQPLEKQLARMAADVIVAGEASFRQGFVEARERAEEHRRWEEDRRLARLADLERKRLSDLRASGEMLRQAEEIRNIVAEIESSLLLGDSPGLTPERVARWKIWALAQANVIDPVLSGQVLSHLYVPELDD